MLDGDWDTCVQMAREQVKEGAHVLDVCVDYVGRDGVADMNEIASRFATQASLPLVFDSTEAPVMEAGLQHSGGKAILNSANLEDGEGPGSRLDKVFTLARDYGAAVICLAIDEEGQARTADWKFRVCKRIHDLAVDEYGLEPTDLIFDCLTFPLGSGQEDLRRDGIETIEAIRRVKAELPGVSTILGVSNVSFGLKPALRHVINSVFLHECVEAGLDAAIVHAARIMPMHKIPDDVRTMALDLVYDRRDRGERLRPAPRADGGVRGRRRRRPSSVRTVRAGRSASGSSTASSTASATGSRPTSTSSSARCPRSAIVNDVLLEGMKVVGELFASGEMQLPFVLQSAETMKAAVAHLEPHMEKADAGGKGTLVIGTVKGDVHDIGKNLVDIILTNNGYEVHNIGIKAPLQAFVDKAKEVEADAIGMSGLLVKSTLIMRENLQEMNTLGLAEIPVLLGGAALTRTYVERDLREVYEGRLFYGKDAFEGLRTMDTLMDGKRTGTLDPDFGRALGGRDLPARRSRPRRRPRAGPSASDVATDVPVFTPPFLGARGQGHRARRDRRPTSTRPRSSATSGSSVPTSTIGPRPTTSSRSGSGRSCARSSRRRTPKACWCRRSRGATSRSTPTATTSWCGPTTTAAPSACASRSRASARTGTSASPTSSGRSTSGDADYAAFHVVTMGATPPTASASSSPPTATRSTCCCTASRSR